MKITLQFDHATVGCNTWVQGDKPIYGSANHVTVITVEGSALVWIRRNIEGVPFMVGAGVESQEPSGFRHPPADMDFSKPIPIDPPKINKLTWYDDDAKFIASNIPGLLE